MTKTHDTAFVTLTDEQALAVREQMFDLSHFPLGSADLYVGQHIKAGLLTIVVGAESSAVAALPSANAVVLRYCISNE